MRAQQLGDRLRVFRLPRQAQVERGQAAMNEPGLHRPGDGADQRAPLPHRLEQLRVAHRDMAEHDVAVAVEGLGVRRHREVGAVTQRRLAEHRRRRVVDGEQRAGGMHPRGERLDVADVEAGVARCLDPDQLDAAEIGARHRRRRHQPHRHAPARQVGLRIRAGREVAVVGHDDGVARLHEGRQHGGGGGDARGESQRRSGLELLDDAFERRPGRVVEAAVLVLDAFLVARQMEGAGEHRAGEEGRAGDPLVAAGMEAERGGGKLVAV